MEVYLTKEEFIKLPREEKIKEIQRVLKIWK